jgi:hypothetical protein
MQNRTSETEHTNALLKVMEKPAAGPTTEAICQTELLQVAALGYTF